MWQYSLFHQNPYGYHLISALLHALNGVLVLALIFYLSRSELLALLTAVAFVVHPLQVESVAWISSQKTLLAASFSLLTLIAYTLFAKKQQPQYYWISLASYFLAIFSKPTVVTLPIVLYALHREFRAEKRSKTIQPLVPFFILALIEGVIVFLAHRQEKAFAPVIGGNIYSHALMPFWTLLTYLEKTFFPKDLLPIYPPPHYVTWANPTYLFPAIGTLAGITLVILLKKRSRIFYLAAGFYAVLLLPTLNLLPLSVPIADRYMYLPILSPLALSAIGINHLYERCKNSLTRIMVSFCVFFIVCILFVNSRTQMSHWKDSRTLWTYTLQKNPRHALAHVKLGEYYYEHGDITQAISYTVKGIGLGLNNPLFAKNLVAMYIDQGKLDVARKSALAFLKQLPDDERFYIQLGIIESESKSDKAEYYLRRATEINPGNAFSWYQLGRFYFRNRKDVDQAYQHFLKSVKLSPYDPRFHLAMADCFVRSGNYEKAIEATRYALSLDETLATSWFNLGNLLKLQGDSAGANLAFHRAFELEPQLAHHQEQMERKDIKQDGAS